MTPLKSKSTKGTEKTDSQLGLGCVASVHFSSNSSSNPLASSDNIDFERPSGAPAGEKSNCEIVIVRVYGKGSDLLVDRQHELDMIKLFSNLGLGGKLYATFQNVSDFQMDLSEMIEKLILFFLQDMYQNILKEEC